MHRTIAGIAGAVALAATVALATPAQAAATTQSWVMNFATIHASDHTVRVTATGPVQGAGYETQTEEETPSGEVVHFTWHFATGSVTGDANEVYDLAFDPTACTAKATSTGAWTLTGGTGAYAGVSGHGTFSGHATLVGTRDERGRCLGPESNAEPKVAIATLRGAGEADAS
jgi:hypothetical protein